VEWSDEEGMSEGQGEGEEGRRDGRKGRWPREEDTSVRKKKERDKKKKNKHTIKWSEMDPTRPPQTNPPTPGPENGLWRLAVASFSFYDIYYFFFTSVLRSLPPFPSLIDFFFYCLRLAQTARDGMVQKIIIVIHSSFFLFLLPFSLSSLFFFLFTGAFFYLSAFQCPSDAASKNPTSFVLLYSTFFFFFLSF
jgi:hypothetical protein